MDIFGLAKVVSDAHSGKISLEEAHTVTQLSSGNAPLFKNERTLNTLDVNGNSLVVGKKYELPIRGDKRIVLIKDEHFGGGNMYDTYYRVGYIYGVNLEETWELVQGTGSPLIGMTFKSKFKPLDSE